MGLNVPLGSFALPWFMLDIDNYQLILSKPIPGDISDTKKIVLTETPIPGLNFAPINPAGNLNRKIGFILPLIKRNNTVGNILVLKQFENLRNQKVSLLNIFSSGGQFTPNPKVLYYWGSGSIPLVYYISKCDFTHKAGWTNAMGSPQYSEVSLELTLDETNVLYVAEEIFRKLASLAGMVTNAYDVIDSSINGGNPY